MLKFISILLFRISGWKTTGVVPPLKKFVVIAAPHTSAWDAVYGLGARYIFDIDISFFGKKEAFWFPLGCFLRSMGGIPVDRFASNDVVKHAVKMFSEREHLILAMAPEGTRQYAPQWRTGFYHIASQAKVPVVLAYIDFARKQVGIGPTFYPTGNMETDIETIKDFYRPIKGRYPEQGVR